ncbi:hypothetical protein RFI_27959 [Reticulomyxa filosa]|uniref:Uncharacterized protein n=1 Tax=Reticulomyxa filosa TaxID=46433 RepID=X6M8S4_RETFI|nr:hypothetical protein RFI_27959 [Reticulomyxa filosa]|eukprot:ETO09415.1 hypothetical protein RFI_27959 [Reticulomyxa filosa]
MFLLLVMMLVVIYQDYLNWLSINDLQSISTPPICCNCIISEDAEIVHRLHADNPDNDEDDKNVVGVEVVGVPKTQLKSSQQSETAKQIIQQNLVQLKNDISQKFQNSTNNGSKFSQHNSTTDKKRVKGNKTTTIMSQHLQDQSYITEMPIDRNDNITISLIQNHSPSELATRFIGGEAHIHLLARQLLEPVHQTCIIYLFCPKFEESIASALLHKFELNRFIAHIVSKDNPLFQHCNENVNLLILEVIKQHKETLQCEHDNVLFVTSNTNTAQYLQSIGTCNVYSHQENGLFVTDCDKILIKYFPLATDNTLKNEEEYSPQILEKVIS